MSGRVRLLAIPPLAALCAVLFLEVAVGFFSGSPFEGPPGEGGGTRRIRSWFETSGFYPPEFETGSQRHFAWTRGDAVIRVPRLDRRSSSTISFVAHAGRPTLPLPELVVTVDGSERERMLLKNERVRVRVPIPAAPHDSVVIGLHLTNTFVPGPDDRRELGMVVEQIAIEAGPEGRMPVPARTRRSVALAGFLYGLAVVLCGAGFLPALGLALLAAAGHAALLLLDAAFLGTLSERLLRIALGVTAAAGLWAVASRVRRIDTAIGTAAALVLTAIGLKLAVFGHPMAQVGDAIFHVHRAEWVHAGRYFFTSITPRPFFEFPYPIGLYVTSLPIWDHFQSTMDRVVMLRGLAVVADAAVALPLFALIRRYWADRTAAYIAAAMYPLLRVSLYGLCTANLSNVFGQGIFGLGMAAIIWFVPSSRVFAGAALGTALLAYGFLSHFSTAAIGGPLVLLVAAAMLGASEQVHRRAAIWILAAVVVASGLSYAVYYSHFHDVYATTLERVAAREGEAERRSMVRPPLNKARDYVARTREGFSDPLLLAAGVGAVLLAVRRARDPLTLAMAGWAVTTALFAVLGILTPVEMRTNLAAQPLVAALGGLGLAATARWARPFGAIAAAVWLAFILWLGVDGWVSCLTGFD